MGHREALLVGAKRCLAEKGYARTTARDIVAASGTNLASIGYHFGSKEALLNQALIEAIGDWGTELARTLSTHAVSDLEPMAQFEVIWTEIIALFAKHRQVLLASFEAISHVDHVPAVKEILSSGLEQGRQGLAQMFGTVAEGAGEAESRAVGSFYQALLTGLLAQWLIDPEHSPSGHDVATALRIITARHRAGDLTEKSA
ncbi:TetR/AcrR family transcriptional regulator [Micromonospora sp. CPCC 205711]|uniref:TetR/AcrR family transcriptional regulator n=1 Tax=Micromonospora sp. CPCC 205547 TaxID=3122400 RepID=UPI002FEF48CE